VIPRIDFETGRVDMRELHLLPAEPQTLCAFKGNRRAVSLFFFFFGPPQKKYFMVLFVLSLGAK